MSPPSKIRGFLRTVNGYLKKVLKMFSVFEKSKSLGGLQFVRSFALRYLSNETEVKLYNEIPKQRRFVKPTTVREFKPFNENFVFDFFTGVIRKDVFNYPSVLTSNELNSLFTHSVEVEGYFRNLTTETEITKDVLNDLKELELFGLSVPQKYGGLGYSETESKFLLECTAVNSKISRFLAFNSEVGASIIAKYGTEEQKQKYLPRLTSGNSFISLAYLEDAPMVDISSLDSTSIVDESNGGFIINGTKKWVHNANLSDLLIVLTKGSGFADAPIPAQFNVFIAEKSTPGITVHKVKSANGRELDIHEIDFNNVFLPNECLIPNLVEDVAFQILKYAQAKNSLNSAIFCLCLMKKMIYSLALHCEKNFIGNSILQEQGHIEGNIGFLTMYTYVLESVVYLISSRFDLHSEPNLFIESCIAKILGTDLLQIAIQIYVEIIGRDSYISPGLLEEALNAIHYCSVFDENNLHLKLMIGSAGVAHAAMTSKSKIIKLRNRFDNPVNFLKYKLKSSKSEYTLKQELHHLLRYESDKLEQCLELFQERVQEHLISHGNKALIDEYHIAGFADIAVYLYALTACLGRASNSYCEHINDSEREITLTKLYAAIVESQVLCLCKKMQYFVHVSNSLKSIATNTFKNKEYPVEHPLARGW